MLDQEERALDVDVELRGLVDLRDRRELGDAGVDEQNVDAAECDDGEVSHAAPAGTSVREVAKEPE
jgi:hypothetical protein